MTRAEAKQIVMPILLRIAKHMPVKGYLAECGGHRQFFSTMDEARQWIHTRPDWAKQEANEMPTISYGYYVNVIMCL